MFIMILLSSPVISGDNGPVPVTAITFIIIKIFFVRITALVKITAINAGPDIEKQGQIEKKMVKSEYLQSILKSSQISTIEQLSFPT